MNKELNPQKDPNFLLSTMDAQVWATEYCRLNPGADMGNMIGWFANAIMVGFDEATRRKEAERTTSPVSQMTDATIREIFMAHGFTIKEGQTDLKPYVYAAARALLSAAPAAPVAEPSVTPEMQAKVDEIAATARRSSERLAALREKYGIAAQPQPVAEHPAEPSVTVTCQLYGHVIGHCAECNVGAEQGELPPLPVDLDYLIEYIAQPAVREALRNQISAYARAAIAASQPPQDERAAFEAWAVSEEGGWMPGALNRQQYGDDYTDDDVQAEWRSWQARAALAKKGGAA